MSCIHPNLTTSKNNHGPTQKIGDSNLDPLTGDLFTTRFDDSIFDEEHFPTLWGDFKYQKECSEINWNAQVVPGTDPCTTKTEL